MYNQSTTKPTSVSSRDLTVRILTEASRQQTEQLDAQRELTTLDSTRRARHWSLVNETYKFRTAPEIIDFYSRRYTGKPADVQYTLNDATDEIVAALSYADVRPITRKAIVDNLTGDALRQYIKLAIVARKAELVAQQARRAATLARITA